MHWRRWRAKAAVQRVFSALPAGHHVNYAFQRITGGLPISDGYLADAAGWSRDHVDAVKAYGAVPLAEARFFEFGAGWDVHGPLLLWSQGVEHQRVVDIRDLLRPDLVAQVAGRIARSSFALDRRPPDGVGPDGSPAAIGPTELRDRFGIDYHAPTDATATGFAEGSVDVVTSTITLEHIPPDTIAAILRECRRLVGPDGLLSFVIDYQDHYAYFDPTIDVFHFLRYDEHEWRRYNSDLHFQNRLRHDHHLDLVTRAGFTVVADTHTPVSDADLAIIDAMPLAAPFRALPPERVAIRRGHIVARPT